MPSKAIGTIRYAMRGVGFMLAERNVRVLAAATLAALAAGAYFRLAALEWCALILALTSIWIAEALNTALERLTDLASPGFHPLAGKAKDVAAAAVFIAVIGAISIGIVIFGPRVL